jgi:uncharacterized protein (DUF983 family)
VRKDVVMGHLGIVEALGGEWYFNLYASLHLLVLIIIAIALCVIAVK